MQQRGVEQLGKEAASQNRRTPSTERGKLTGCLRRTQGDEASTRTIDETANLFSAPSASQRVGEVAGLLVSDLGRGRERGGTMRVRYSRAVTESIDVFHAAAGETWVRDDAVLLANL
jgi:hypothetical protein